LGPVGHFQALTPDQVSGEFVHYAIIRLAPQGSTTVLTERNRCRSWPLTWHRHADVCVFDTDKEPENALKVMPPDRAWPRPFTLDGGARTVLTGDDAGLVAPGRRDHLKAGRRVFASPTPPHLQRDWRGGARGCRSSTRTAAVPGVRRL